MHSLLLRPQLQAMVKGFTPLSVYNVYNGSLSLVHSTAVYLFFCKSPSDVKLFTGRWHLHWTWRKAIPYATFVADHISTCIDTTSSFLYFPGFKRKWHLSSNLLVSRWNVKAFLPGTETRLVFCFRGFSSFCCFSSASCFSTIVAIIHLASRHVYGTHPFPSQSAYFW